MPSDIQLSEIDKLASVLYIIAAFLVIESADKTEQAASSEQIDVNKSNNSNGPTPIELIAAAGKIYLIGNLLFFRNSVIRLKQDQQDIESGKKTTSLFPSILATSGWILSVLGSILRAAGQQLEVNEQF